MKVQEIVNLDSRIDEITCLLYIPDAVRDWQSSFLHYLMFSSMIF